MKQKVMRAWVRALRSRKYKQGKYALRSTTRAGNMGSEFCCLGVLCDLYAQEHPDDAQWVVNGSRMSCSFSPRAGEIQNNVPHALVMEWAGLKTENGEFRAPSTAWDDFGFRGSCAQELTSVNDNGATFRQIATFIEKHWRRL